MVGPGQGTRRAAQGACARGRSAGISVRRGRPSPCLSLRQDAPRGSGGRSSAYGQCLKSVRQHTPRVSGYPEGPWPRQWGFAGSPLHCPLRTARGQSPPPTRELHTSFQPCNYLARRLGYCHKASHPPKPREGNRRSVEAEEWKGKGEE